jgi:hypothetical protein
MVFAVSVIVMFSVVRSLSSISDVRTGVNTNTYLRSEDKKQENGVNKETPICLHTHFLNCEIRFVDFWLGSKKL